MGKHILVITDYAAPYEGNFIMSLKSLEQEIEDDDGKIIYLFIKKASHIGWVKKLNNVYFLENSIIKNIKIINNLIKSKKIDVLYTHFCLPKTQLAVKVSKNLNRKVLMVSHFHNHYEDPKNIIKKYIFRYVFNGDINIGCSKDVAESLPLKKGKNKYVTNAIDFTRLEEYSNIEPISKGKFIILMFGYTYYRKGVDLAIKALKKINKADIVLAISVSKDIDGFKQEIINDFGEVPDFVKILSPRNDIATYYKASNLFLSAAREEGFCYAIIESMYFGIPCICTKLPGQPNEVPDLIKVESQNIEDLSNAVLDVYNKKNVFEKEKVRIYLSENYSINRWSKKIKEIIYNEF